MKLLGFNCHTPTALKIKLSHVISQEVVAMDRIRPLQMKEQQQFASSNAKIEDRVENSNIL